jgi:hypothetical protein
MMSKSLKQALDEFDYGNALFADPDSIHDFTGEEKKYQRWLSLSGTKYEDDTDEEYEFLKAIAGYVADGTPDQTKISNTFIRKHGKALKSKFPEILDPEYNGKLDNLYRGASLKTETIIDAINKDMEWQRRIKPGGDLYNFIMENPIDWYDLIDDFRSANTKVTKIKGGPSGYSSNYWIGINYTGKVSSRNKSGFLSTSTQWGQAKSFGSGGIRNKLLAGRYPCVIAMPFSEMRDKAFLNPDWAGSIAEYEESEVWILGDSMPVNRLWVRAPDRTNIQAKSTAQGPLIKALYWQHIDPKKFDAVLRDAFSDGKSPYSNKRTGFDKTGYVRTAWDSPIIASLNYQDRETPV